MNSSTGSALSLCRKFNLRTHRVLQFALVTFGSLGLVTQAHALGKKPAGFVPDCDMVTTAGCKGANVTESVIANAAGCGPGKFRVMRFDTDVRREQMCFDMSSCGAPAIFGESWGVCQYYSGDVIKYKCLKFSSTCPGI